LLFSRLRSLLKSAQLLSEVLAESRVLHTADVARERTERAAANTNALSYI